MKKVIVLLLVIFAIVGVALWRRNTMQVSSTGEQPQGTSAVPVEVQEIAASKSSQTFLEYPGIVASESEVKITASTAGTAVTVNFDLGDKVYTGKQLVRIDDLGALSPGEKQFRSGDIQQLELAVEQAKESLDLAKKNYKKDRSIGNRATRELAEIQYENAKVALKSAVDAHNVVSPINGTVTQRAVSSGDSVTQGQLLAVVSQPDKIKVQFFVSAEELVQLQVGESVAVKDNAGNELPAKIDIVSLQADTVSRRFLIEAKLTDGASLPIGSIVAVNVQRDQATDDGNTVFLPLSSIIIDQNESYLFIEENNRVGKRTVEIIKIDGEVAQVKGTFSDSDKVIVKGNKLVQEGDAVEVTSK